MAKSIEAPRNARGKRTVEALLVAARELIAAEGFEATTMSAVASRAGVTRRAVYLHFTSRAELVGAVLREVGETERLGESLQRVWDAQDAEAALEEWARHLARAHPALRPIVAAADRARRTDAEAAKIWDEVMGRWRRGSRRLATWLDDEGRLAEGWTVDAAADMLWALMSTDVLERLTVDRAWSDKRYGEQLGKVLTSTFLARSQ